MNTIKRMWPRAAAIFLACALGASAASAAAADSTAVAQASGNGITICLDPGHQRKGNNNPEPVGPGAKETKPKVSSGTTGVATKTPEYVRTLEVSKRIQEKLLKEGYRVVMTRETHDVDISNKERAEIANDAKADLFLRIHADGDGSAATKGMSVLYPAKSISYTEEQYTLSKSAAEKLLADTTAATGAKSRGTVARSDLSGFNWSKVPNVLIEMGFMTNREEDLAMADSDYQEKIADGIVSGIDRFFSDRLNTAGKQQPYTAKLNLLESTPLYVKKGNRYTADDSSITPQKVTTTAKDGSWYEIETWLGNRWIYVEQAVIGDIKSVSEMVKLDVETPFYRTPFVGRTPLGRLSPQKVQAFESWNGWYHIRTWLGNAWIQTDGGRQPADK